MTSIYLDGNVLNYFVENAIDPVRELAGTEIQLLVPPQIRHEIDSIPADKTSLLALIVELRKNGHLETDWRLGFADANDPESGRFFGRLGRGRLSSLSECEFEEKHRGSVGTGQRPTGLRKNEADLALAAMATTDWVLTCDLKSGPLRSASVETGRVIDVRSFDPLRETFREFVLARARAA